jgi:hypothetical protein
VAFTCPRCGSVSHNPNDERERYCGWCHLFVEKMPPVPPDPYYDPKFAARDCDHCGKSYQGPAVYCSLVCALADAE